MKFKTIAFLYFAFSIAACSELKTSDGTQVFFDDAFSAKCECSLNVDKNVFDVTSQITNTYYCNNKSKVSLRISVQNLDVDLEKTDKDIAKVYHKEFFEKYRNNLSSQGIVAKDTTVNGHKAITYKEPLELNGNPMYSKLVIFIYKNKSYTLSVVGFNNETVNRNYNDLLNNFSLL
jgi:hypothetical protein